MAGSSGWGLSISGLAETISLFEQLKISFDGDTVYLVGPSTEYAVYHELGTSKMEARPFMRPAAERVQANLSQYVKQISRSQGIPLTSEANVVKCAALAVEAEAKKIADQKDIRDTGETIASIKARKES
jgi:hypothetical protein